MELSSINKLRIAAVAALGIVVLGLLAWPLAAPVDPLAPVRAWSIGPSGTLALLVLAFGLGFVGYFIAWPHGREIGILAVPFGLTIWAGRSGPMRVLMQAYREPAEREALASSLRFEPIYWLLLVAAGFAGVLLAQYMRSPSAQPVEEPATPNRPGGGIYVTVALAVAGTVLIANFLLGVFAQDVATSRNMAPTQPPVGQILFAVVAAFATTAFLVKKLTDLSYLWPALASALVLGFAQAFYDGAQILRQFAETRPATSFPHSTLAILPVQLVPLGTLGSILGYWLAVRYDWWRKHEAVG
ncbi:MAG: hypothetical protein M1376_20255 [Planctomycetes bacterium]|nr:hypothetical protein [Planctomycetota bacterium]